MRILHIIPELKTGGAEKMLVDIIEEQIDLGAEVTVLISKRLNNNLEERVSKLATLNCSNISEFYSISAIAFLVKYLRNKNFDVVHSHLTPSQVSCFFAYIFKSTRALYITTEHNTSNRRRNTFIYRISDYLIYLPYKKIICISDGTAESLKNWLPLTSNKLEVILNGIRIDDYINKYSKISNDRSGFLTVISVARLEPQKDHDTLIRAIVFCPQVKLLLVGEGTRRAILETLVSRLGLTSRVVFLGNRSDVPALLAAADVYVQSSHWEGFGLAALEAMAVGLPTIASDVSGLREVVGGAGTLFTPRDELALADAINSMGNDSFRKTVADNCYVRAQAFDIRATAAAYMRVYKRFTHDTDID
ncbi:glycosyltransferase [Deinococcus sp. QL22]|uniref:glycosyltransferase n=1 Tax=Deinococcus sp. QL22 TaxID=2939437 RepID=UPI00201828BF|nr:glycosyltransferase [Deinococcus sp. QL22]UQN09564.1 glycosyltransferase [Deinococcus sp. QL22]